MISNFYHLLLEGHLSGLYLHSKLVGGHFVQKLELYSFSQWLTFKLLGIAYLVGEGKLKLLFHGPLAE